MTLILAPAHAARHLADHLSNYTCACEGHAEQAIGARSAEAAAYPPKLCQAMADFIEAATR